MNKNGESEKIKTILTMHDQIEIVHNKNQLGTWTKEKYMKQNNNTKEKKNKKKTEFTYRN